LTTGNVDIEIGPTNIRRTVKPVVESIRMKAAALSRDDKLELRTDISDDLPEYVELDGRRLQQILYNLLGNAIKFGRRGKFIDFSIKVVQTNDIANSSDIKENSQSLPNNDTVECVKGAYILFSVKDYGMGIAEQDRKKIFQPFQQSSSNDAADGGTGLGLAITSQLCKVLGGTISVTSEKGEWSEFVVKLPLVKSKAIPQQRAEECSSMMEMDNHDRRSTFRRSMLVGTRSNRQLSTTLLSGLPRLSKSFHARSTVSPTLNETGGRCDETVSDIPNPNSPISENEGRSNDSQSSAQSQMVQRILPLVQPNVLSRVPSPVPKNCSTTAVTKLFQDVRVLIAEDNLVNQKVLLRTLQKIGVKIIDVVQNGLEAVNMSAEKQYDIIFMDWCMPVMDGLQSTKLIVARRKKQPQSPHPRIVFLTAHALEDYRKNAAEAGGDGFISKPFKAAAIKELLEHFRLGQNVPTITSQNQTPLIEFSKGGTTTPQVNTCKGALPSTTTGQ
ncbi:MAG: response regulator, partial [Flammeovirgaceae bacterium]|nr:response regulator [Flammeovirgaceae bacterium]